MLDLPVSESSLADLAREFGRLGIREEDLDETFIRSGGHGGQNVNKVSTCVVLTHRPSGLTVRCQRERSQGLNRFLARRLLAEKLAARLLEEKTRRQSQAEKVRRQKRRRSRRSKEKMLENKRIRGQLKAQRSRPGGSRESAD